ncbi:uncharacterized protein LOC121249367 [Juglans microcarpa x Juglans regia]|uniref:uncharacterized protein LOC121249367 n=1 Tax=Juglans microcarpa x Juglans regia TaxID=2249226 RepID=UPI001B7E6298|nr:uncharacterized protein LOC121249367 [Juglans microcarpa x Juglans regia]
MEGCEQVVEGEWRKGDKLDFSMQRIQMALTACSGALVRWSKRKENEEGKDLKEKTDQLEKLSVTPLMNEKLLRSFTKEEVEAIVFQMGPLKSPRPDGFGACFYYNFWSIVGKEVKEPILATDYRQISLCNVLDKIIPKTLANRLKLVLDKIISSTQSAFIPGRLISNNILVAYEALHSMKKKRHGRVGSIAIKVDMSKAYDRVEWKFFEGVMRRLGSDERWNALIMSCVSSISFEVLLDGQPGGVFKPTKGLRQGDFLAKMEDWRAVKGLLEIYERTSANALIDRKLRFFFSSNTKAQERRLIKEEVGARVSGCYEKYLGLPEMIVRNFDRDSKVTKLIDDERGCWRVEVIKDKLNVEEAEVVCNIPISLLGQRDKVIWGHTKNGVLNVKSTYHLEMERRCKGFGESSDSLGWRDMWKSIWSLNLPGVVKSFMWKALNNCIPTRENLNRRRVIEDSLCPICKKEDETPCHVLWKCLTASDVSAEPVSSVQKWSSTTMNLKYGS